MFEEVVLRLINREADSNKYDFGHVLVFGGAPGMVGAPMLCALGALRIGAGLVTIASSPEVIDKLEKRVLEIMTLRIGGFQNDNLQTLKKFIDERRVTVLVAGPGFDRSHAGLLEELLANVNVPVILDAGAVTNFSGKLDELKNIASKNKNIIITPHDGELKKLTSIEISKDPKEKQNQVRAIAKDMGLTLVAKGQNTIVAENQGDIYENHSGSASLASAGTGDVLAGVIAGLIAQGIEHQLAAKVGVYIHGIAGELAGDEKTEVGVIASDVIEFLPKALKYLSKDLK